MEIADIVFTDWAGRNKNADSLGVRCWYSDEKFERRERALILAEKKNVEPFNIALAYVLAQPFSLFALIGPQTIAETASTFSGLAVTLTSRDTEW